MMPSTILNTIFSILVRFWTFFVVVTLGVFNLFYKYVIYRETNKKFHYYFSNFMLYLSILWSSGTSMILFLLRPGDERNISITSNVARYIAKEMGIDVIIRNSEYFSKDEAAIVIVNHQHILDTIVTLHFWDITARLIALGKRALMFVPPYGPMALLAGLPFIDRNNTAKAYEQLEKITAKLKRTKTKLLVYPEGTRNLNSKELLPFKKGAFNMAVMAQIPIIPIVISPYYFIDRKNLTFDTGRVIIQFLDPVQTKGLTKDDVPDLTNKIRDMMLQIYKDLTKEVLNSASQMKANDIL